MFLFSVKQTPTINILYKYNELTSVELLWNDDKYNTNTHCLVHGFIRNIRNKHKIIPQEINQTILAFALFVPIKYELNIYKGNLMNNLEPKYEIKYVENIYDDSIAFCHLVLVDVQNVSHTSYNLKMFAIRSRAIVTEKIASNYSSWVNFETASKHSLEHSDHARTQHNSEQNRLAYRESLTYFWNKSFLKQNQAINLQQWLLVWQQLNIKKIFGLSEYELKRIYYFLVTKPGNQQIGKEQLYDFVKPEVLTYRSAKFKPGFACKQWLDLKRKMATFIFEYFRESTLDFHELERLCKYKRGYNNEHKIIVWFWQILHSLNDTAEGQFAEEQFLAFLSHFGRFKPPRRNKQIQLMIEKATADHYKGDGIPRVFFKDSKDQTILLLPAYASQELMRQKLMQAIYFTQ